MLEQDRRCFYLKKFDPLVLTLSKSFDFTGGARVHIEEQGRKWRG